MDQRPEADLVPPRSVEHRRQQRLQDVPRPAGRGTPRRRRAPARRSGRRRRGCGHGRGRRRVTAPVVQRQAFEGDDPRLVVRALRVLVDRRHEPADGTPPTAARPRSTTSSAMAKARPSHGSANTGSPSSAGHAAAAAEHRGGPGDLIGVHAGTVRRGAVRLARIEVRRRDCRPARRGNSDGPVRRQARRRHRRRHRDGPRAGPAAVGRGLPRRPVRRLGDERWPTPRRCARRRCPRAPSCRRSSPTSPTRPSWSPSASTSPRPTPPTTSTCCSTTPASAAAAASCATRATSGSRCSPSAGAASTSAPGRSCRCCWPAARATSSTRAASTASGPRSAATRTPPTARRSSP